MGRDSGAWDFLDEKTGTDTGFSSDGGMVRLYDPVSGKYVWRATKGDPLSYNPRNGKTKYMYTPEGERVLGANPGDDFPMYMNPDLEGLQVGYQPDQTFTPRDLSLGDRPNPDGTYGTAPDTLPDAGQPDPTKTPTGAGPGYGGGHVPTPNDYGAPINYGIEEQYDVGEVDPFDSQGFGMSTNADFYADQAARLRTQEFRNHLREGFARDKAKEAANAPPAEIDPWGWAGGEDQFTPTMGTGEPAPVSWSFNNEYDGMGLNDIWNKVSDLDVFSSSDSSDSARDVLNKVFKNRGDMFSGFDPSKYSSTEDAWKAFDSPDLWAGLNRPNVAKQGFRDILSQVYDVTGYGPSAPVGYANPVGGKA